MPQAVIPVQMYSVIAGILAGDQAFGTLANLNLANHAIRDETLPVLFETLLFDDYVTLAQWMKKRTHVPAGFQYTKFFLASTGSSLGDTYDWLHLLPNLALTVSLGSPPPGGTCFDYCIRLYKPLKPITVFGCVTKTRLSPRLLKDLAQDETGHPISDETSMPSASRRLMRFVLEHGAYFIAEDPAAPNNVAEWTTNIAMENSYFVEDPGPVSSTAGDEPSITNDGQIADTICELLKLTIRQCPSVSVEEGRHLGILHTRPAVDKFFEKLPRLLVDYPQLLIHGIRLDVRSDYSKDQLTDVLHRIQKTLQQPTFFKYPVTYIKNQERSAIAVLEKEIVEIAPPDSEEQNVYSYWQVGLYIISRQLTQIHHIHSGCDLDLHSRLAYWQLGIILRAVGIALMDCTVGTVLLVERERRSICAVGSGTPSTSALERGVRKAEVEYGGAGLVCIGVLSCLQVDEVLLQVERRPHRFPTFFTLSSFVFTCSARLCDIQRQSQVRFGISTHSSFPTDDNMNTTCLQGKQDLVAERAGDPIMIHSSHRNPFRPRANRSSWLPNLALTMSLSWFTGGYNGVLEHLSCAIHLHKPLRPVTIFGYIIKTRFPLRSMKPRKPDIIHPVTPTDLSSSIPRLVSFALGHSGYFRVDDLPTASCHEPEWTTDIAMTMTVFSEESSLLDADNADSSTYSSSPTAHDELVTDARIADTFCELLKLAKRQNSPLTVEQPCRFSLHLFRSSTDMFLDESPSLFASHPELLSCGLKIYLQNDHPKDDMTATLHRFQTIMQQPNFFQQPIALSEFQKKRAIVVLEKDTAEEAASRDWYDFMQQTHWEISLYMKVEGTQITSTIE